MPFVVLLSSLSTLAQTQDPNPGHYKSKNGQVVFNLNACTAIPCTLSYDYATITVEVGQFGGCDQGRCVWANGRGPINIKSNFPIIQALTGRNFFSNIEMTDGIATTKINGPTAGANQTWQKIATQAQKVSELQINVAAASTYIYVYQIAVQVGTNPKVLPDNLRKASVELITVYENVLEQLTEFRKIIAKDSADLRHLTRLQGILAATLKMMTDENKIPLLPVTDSRVTEASRMIMALSTVLEEITSKYDFESEYFQKLKPARDSLVELSSAIRESYGWKEGLAGSGSKALAALSSVLDIELRNINSLLSVFNDDPALTRSLNQLIRVNYNLHNVVSASNAGDAAGGSAGEAVIAQWNSEAFQNILKGMMNAPREAQASLQNRLLMAMTTMESIRDYIDPKGEKRLTINVPVNVKSKLP